jgi:catechol-2,3-dioxygenase
MSSPSRLAHIVFRTNKLETMIDWYCTVLDAHVVFANEKIAFITYDDEHHRIALIATETFASRPATINVGFYHAAFSFGSLMELLNNFDRLKTHKIEPWRTINHGQTVSFYYKDPDGNDIELQVDRFANAMDAQAWMAGEAFASNPIGILVDPVDLRRRLETGEPLESIMRRADESPAATEPFQN